MMHGQKNIKLIGDV